MFSLIVKRDGVVTVLNLNDFPIRLTLSVDSKKYKIKSVEDMKLLQSNENEVRVRLKENSFGVLRLENV
ncbi:permease [Sulfolobus islandicus M.16.4]|uniref:Permease n=1 Tax=Saccharolobus islandicus (strain M.16.4 / Kamchatka \|nr:permease [Sulfolobus islandicus M.16.4]